MQNDIPQCEKEGVVMQKRSNLVQSVIRALEILELLDVEKELGISEISDMLGLEKSTVHRLISTLKHKGYVMQNSSNYKYSNSFKLFEMGNNVVERLGLRRQAQPYMEELAEKSHETVNLAIMDGKDIIYIDKIESPETIKVDLNVGKRLPSYCTGLGKAMLAFMPEGKVVDLLREETLIPYTKNTITDMEALINELRKIREQGYSIDNEEYVEGLVCVASPIRNYRGEAVAAMSIALPKYRIDEGKKNLEYIVDLIRGISDRFSRQLAFKE